MRKLLSSLLLALLVLPFVGSAKAAAQTSGEGIAVAGDFRGNGRSQIASLYDAYDDQGLRIDLLDANTSGTFSSNSWYFAGAGTWDITQMKVAAVDVDGDGRSDLVVLYQTGDISSRLYVLRSTGYGFTWDRRAWWESDGYDWDRVEEILGGHFSAAGRAGLILVYQYDNDRTRMHYFEAAGNRLLYAGDGGVYDSGEGQYDASRAKFQVGHFTRRDGPDQIAAAYAYPNARVRIHVFEPTPLGIQPVQGWAGLYDSGEGQYELDQAKVVATDLDGDGLTDLVALYGYPDGSVRVHLFAASRSLALTNSSGVSALSAGTLAWGPSKVVAGRWYTDGRSSLSVLTPFSNGATEASIFRGVGGGMLSYAASQWTTPWYEQRTPSSPIGLAMSPDFCSTHSCIPNFPNGRGYAVMCADGQYSQSGGIQGACSHHGGTVTHSGSSYHAANGGSLSTYSRSGSRASSGLSSYGSRTQYVSGHFRKNGTYVAPYYRRPPSRTSLGRGRGRR